MLMTARTLRNMNIFGDRLYFDEHGGGIKLHPRNYIDDSPTRPERSQTVGAGLKPICSN